MDRHGRLLLRGRVRLTRSEALALYLRGKALLGAPGLAGGPALASALAKIEEGLGPEERWPALAGRVAVGGGPAGRRALARCVRRPWRRRERSRSTTTRPPATSSPLGGSTPSTCSRPLGNWYVVAWDHRSEDERLFRVDRIRSVGRPARPSSPGASGSRPAPVHAIGARRPVRLRLGPGARWVAEYYEVGAGRSGARDGALEVTFPVKDLPGWRSWSFGWAARPEVLAPPELLTEWFGHVARAALARYESGPDPADRDPSPISLRLRRADGHSSARPILPIR